MKMSRFSIKSMMIGAACVGLLMSQPKAKACTGIQLQTEDGTFVSGRTLEFGISFDSSIMVVPRNYEFVGQTTLGDGKRWKTSSEKHPAARIGLWLSCMPYRQNWVISQKMLLHL